MFKKLYIVLVIIGFAMMGCTDPNRARTTLEDNGFTSIETTGYQFGACSQGDAYATGFKALGPTRKKVVGTVCSGVVKGATIRFD